MMGGESRISAEEAVAAYKSTGLRPLCGLWTAWDDGADGLVPTCACPAIVVLAARKGLHEAIAAERDDSMSDALGVEAYYLLGFASGVDDQPGDMPPPKERLDDGIFMAGYEDGKVVWGAIEAAWKSGDLPEPRYVV